MKISEFKKMIKDYISEDENVMGLGEENVEDLDEAKKKKDTEEEITVDDITDETPAEETETTIDVTTDQVDPAVKAVQDALTQAQSAAQQLGDPKLTDQIGNTITFFTRAHIVKPQEQVNEEMPITSEEYVVAIEDLNTNEVSEMFTGPKKKALTAYNNIGNRYWDNDESRVFIMKKIIFDSKYQFDPESKNYTEKENMKEIELYEMRRMKRIAGIIK